MDKAICRAGPSGSAALPGFSRALESQHGTMNVAQATRSFAANIAAAFQARAPRRLEFIP
jgi:hypothetical protein